MIAEERDAGTVFLLLWPDVHKATVVACSLALPVRSPDCKGRCLSDLDNQTGRSRAVAGSHHGASDEGREGGGRREVAA
jgi:hypothetical protein